MKASLAAFGRTGEGFPEAPTFSGCPTFEVQVLEIDGPTLEILDSWPKQAADVVQYATQGYFPDCDLTAQKPRIILGGAESLEQAQTYAQMAESQGIPTVAYASYVGDAAAGSLQDAAAFAAYASVKTRSDFSTRQLVQFAASNLGAAKVNFWHCDEDSGHHAPRGRRCHCLWCWRHRR